MDEPTSYENARAEAQADREKFLRYLKANAANVAKDIEAEMPEGYTVEFDLGPRGE